MRARLIAVDLDGTLLNSRREVSSANREALREAVERGAEIVITTGRRFHSARPILESLPCPVTLISSNGALVANPTGEVLRRKFLPREIARAALNAAQSFRPFAAAIYHVAGAGQIVLEENASPEGPLAWYQANCPECVAFVHDLASGLPGDPVHIMFGGPPATLDPLENILRRSEVAGLVHCTWTKYLARNLSLLDVLDRGCSKAEAVEWWAAHKGVLPSEVVAIGDNFNDLELLEFAGRAVVMANATPGLARDSWRQTLSNDEDGVAVALRALAAEDARAK